jgi:TM2 domain-containing membrane protein YozV
MKPFEFQGNAKNPAVAAILSFFFIGLGQAYNGEIAKAILFLILYAASIFLTFFTIGFVTTPVLWIWSMMDAYSSSQKMNQSAARQSSSNAQPSGLVMNVHVGS